MTVSAGRKGHRWRQARELVLRQSNGICAHCRHPGAGEVDHIVALPVWTAQGGDGNDVANLRAVHGVNAPCRTCGCVFNQQRNRRQPVPVPLACGCPDRPCRHGTTAATFRPALDW